MAGTTYVQLRVDLGNGCTTLRRRPPNADTLNDAEAKLERKRTERRDSNLPQTGRRPCFDDYAYEHLASEVFLAKKMGMQGIERQAINRWIAHIGGVRVDKITPAHIHGYRKSRLKLERMARTMNLETIALRNGLKLSTVDFIVDRICSVW